MSKAIAAAWNCGGSGITASVGENGPCSVPSVDKLIEAASPDGTDSVDPDGVALGDPSNPSSMADAADVDSPESDGKNVRDPYAGEAFPPTPQQREVVDAVLTGEDVKVLALAGTGKTSTLKLIARRLGREQPKKRIIYVAFNKSIQTEADATMPDNVESRTADSISFRAMPKEITDKIDSKTALVKAKDIGSHFGIFGYTVANLDGEKEELSQYETIRALQKAITKYTNSADDEIGAQHFEDFDADDQMLDWANAIWADINSPKGVIRLTNSHITKMWALTRPDLSKNGSGLTRPADIIFFDEAQDINPVLGKVIADQKIQKIYVGDSNQAIYGFRGAVDQLEQVDAQYELPLTKSWRFGPQIAGIGNRFLALIGAKQRIEGAGPEGVIVERGTMTDAQAVLVRTNIGAIKEISTELNNGRSVGVSKNFKDDLDSLSRSANWLKNGGPKPGKIHEEIAPFSSWAELQKAIADEETSQKLGTFLELIDEVGFDGLDEMLSRLKIYKSSEDGLGASPSAPALPELTVESARTGSKGTIVDGVEYTIIGDMIALTGKKLFDNKEVAKKLGFKWDPERKRWAKSISSDNGRLDTLAKLRNGMGGGSQEDDRIDVVITTAHRAKGLEWDKVRIGDDFWGPRIDKDTGNKTMPSPEELKLDYVAVTRAKKELDPGGLEWVFAETSDADESPNMPEASAPEENIPPPPPSPEADAGDIIPPPPPGSDETALGAPEPDPEDGLSGTPETPDAFDPLDETPPYTGPVQDVNVINDEASVAQATYEGFDKDYADAVDALNAELVFLREEGNAKEKKAAKELQRAKDVIDRFDNGEISRAEAIEQLKALEEEALERAKKSSGSEERVLNEQVGADIAEVRRVLDATASTGILVSKHYPPEGSGKGFDKNGVFIKIGDRVRDKWGYAGTVTRYNSSGGWNNIYIKKDVDGRDPNKIDPKKWGPGYIDSKGTGSVTVIKEGEDNSPYIPVPGKESKGPQRLDEQLAKLQSNKDSGDKGDEGLGVRPFMGPEDDDSGGAAGEPAAGTTEALRENVEARSEADAWSGDEESRTDTPKGEAPSGATAEAPEASKADAPEANNSPEVTTKLGTDISTPDVTQPDTKAAPDHTPQDYELIKKMIAEGPQAVGSEMTANWVKHIEEFRAKRDVDPDAEDDDAERGIDFIEKYDRSRRDELRDDTEGDAFLQNLLLGISMFVETGPQRADKEWYNDSFIRGEEKTLTDLIDPSRESVRSFYTDIARYYENPDLIDQELTPASAFLRAVRSARKKDGEFARVLSFDKKISDPEHPLHRLLTIGQEIDLRPSSWTSGDNVGNLEAIIDKYHDALESDPVKRQKILDNTTNIILSVNGADAFDISKYGIREERESVLTNGRYRVTNVERVEVPLNSEMFDDMYMAAVKISIELVESPKAEEVSTPEETEVPEALPEPVKDEDGVWVGEIPYEELQKMKRTGSHPDKLPFFMQMGDDPGDGYFWTAKGNRFWGKYGAAGTLLRYKDPETGEYRYLLGKRADWISAGGGKWGIPGGAHKDLDASEDPTSTAFAELKEELGIDLGESSDDPRDGPGVVSEFHFSDLDPDWSYDTFIVDVEKPLATSASISDSETSEIGFFTLDEIKKMADNGELHPAFASSIDDIIDLAKESETGDADTNAGDSGTGVAPAPEGPQDSGSFDASDVENIPSINSTLDTLRGSAMPRADVLVDGGDIEDTRVTFTKETRVDGSGIVARFKLTSWAGKRQLDDARLSKDWTAQSGPNAIAFETKVLDTSTGRAVVDQSGERGGTFNPDTIADMTTKYGTRHTYVDPDGRFTIDIYESDKNNTVVVGYNTRAHQFNTVDNKVEIKFADDNPSEEVMKEAFKLAGVQDPRAARPEDIKTLIENRLISVLGQMSDPSDNPTGDKRKSVLDMVESKWGVTADDIEVSINADGLLDMKMPESVAKKIADETQVKGFSHSLMIVDNLFAPSQDPREVAEKIFKIVVPSDDPSSQHGLLSTQERFDSGLQVTGMSSDTDMSTGGADYVYLGMTDAEENATAKNGQNLNKEETAVLFFDPIEILRNTAVWANATDDFGQRRHDNVIRNIRPRGYEFMVKRHLGMEGLRSIVVSVDVRNELLKKLHDAGVTEINGVPIKDFVKLFAGVEDKQEWKPGDELLDKVALTAQIADKTMSSDVMAPTMDYVKFIMSKNSAFILSEKYHSLPSFDAGNSPILFVEKSTGRLIVYNKVDRRLEIHVPGQGTPHRLSAKAIKKLNEMIDSGEINDIAFSLGTYGAAGIDLTDKKRRDIFFEAEYDRIYDELVAATTMSQQRKALLQLVGLERANVSKDLREKIAIILNGSTGVDTKTLAPIKDARVPDYGDPDNDNVDNVFWTPPK